MTDSLIDDVKALLEKDFGDDRILKQIHRACENNEVISNYERNYVRKLAEKHLGRKTEVTQTPSIEKPPTPKIETPPIPDVEIIPPQSVQKTQTFQTQTPRVSSSNPKTSKILLGIGGVVIIAIIAAVFSFAGSDTPSTSISVITNPMSKTLSVQTDFSTYDFKDLISIHGTSNVSEIVNLSIENENGELVWAEQVSLKNDGRYSTLAIAGGTGWENPGTYTLKVNNGEETKSTNFSFTA